MKRLIGEKTGVFTGAYAINPVNQVRIPIWIADYVLMTYGSGAIMAVPAHDQRDFEFATKFGLDIVEVIRMPGRTAEDGPLQEAYSSKTEGTMVNSGAFNEPPCLKRSIKLLPGWMNKRSVSGR